MFFYSTGFNDPKEADPRLQVPLFDIIFPFLPEKILKPLRFGVPYEKVWHFCSCKLFVWSPILVA